MKEPDGGECKLAYKITHDQLTTGEQARSSRFTLILVADSILLVFWGNLYTDGCGSGLQVGIMIGISVFGFVINLLWAAQMERLHGYMNKLHQMAVRLEGRVLGNTPRYLRPHTVMQDKRGELKNAPLRSMMGIRILSTGAPLVLAVLYLVLLWASIDLYYG